ncbi:hypothetical protein [Methylobacterium sp. GC_Met_2]|uniref:hypothetical protein n=1 Tax=Methylobacterium sp. GC_Met_2 TaxID=2937376 RepID=UPI00226B179D|nr:hypothetical protein [Methylobacterium sp. GC_Met_2]
MRPLAFHWHRFREWVDDLGAARAFARVRRDHALARRLFASARRHGAAADAICPPAGPGGEPPPEAAPPEWDARLEARGGHSRPHPPVGVPGSPPGRCTS